MAYLQVNEINLGNIHTASAFEQFLYDGGDLGELLSTEKNSVVMPESLKEDCVWIINPSFHHLFMGNTQYQAVILPEDQSWLISALEISKEHQHKPVYMAAADDRGNFVTCKLVDSLPPNEFFTLIRLLNFDERKQVTYSAKQQSGMVAILDCDTGRESSDIEQFLNNSGIAHSPVCSLPPNGKVSALTNVIQLAQMAFSIEYRTHYASNFSGKTSTVYSKSVPWFVSSSDGVRSGLLMSLNSPTSVIEVSSLNDHTMLRKINRKQFLVMLSGNNSEELLSQINQIASWMNQGLSLPMLEQKTTSDWNSDDQYRVCLVAGSLESLAEELEQAQKGIASSLESGREWQSRGGSYFTPTPLGSDVQVAFVYPGAFNSYVGMGAELLHRFPFLHDWLSEHTDNPEEIYQAATLFPRTWGTASDEELEQLQIKLLEQPLSMLFSGTAVAGMYTCLLQEVFGVQPNAAYGYSLGEITMFFATGFWQRTNQVKQEITESDLYKNRIAGSMDAVREFWDQLGLTYSDSSVIWNNMILMTSLERAREAVAKEPMAYLTHVNTHRQVVIGGEPDACKRVVEDLHCMKFPIPVNYPMHCAPVSSEFNALRNLTLQPIESPMPITFYGAYNRGPYQLDSNAIAETVAGGLVNQVDFDALTKRIYADGYAFFIEVGARSNCSKWIERSLKSESFCATSVNQAEVADEVCFMKVIARLVSHGKMVNLPVVEMEA